MSQRLARLISNLLNPFLVSLIVIILLSFQATSSAAEAIRWSLISLACSVLPVFAVVVYLVRQHKLEGIFVNPRRQRNQIFWLAIACAVLGCFVLSYWGAPGLLLATFVAGLAAIVAFTGVNLLWKISLHTAFVAASVTILVIVYGAMGALTAVLLPPVAWARIKLGLHSPAQVTGGALLAAVIVFIVFRFFRLTGAHI